MSKNSLLILLIPLSQWRMGEKNQEKLDESTHFCDFFYCENGWEVTSSGQSILQELPHAAKTIGVLMPNDVAWHRVLVPKVHVSRLKAALFGLLEEQLLGESHEIHLARSRFATIGHRGWIASIYLAHLNSCIANLQHAGHHLDAVVPLFEPRDDLDLISKNDPDLILDQVTPTNIHVQLGNHSKWELVVSSSEGIICLPCNAPMVQSWKDDPSTIWSAEPELASDVGHWLGREPTPLAKVDRLLQSARQGTNLLQFDLIPRSSGSRRMMEWLSAFTGRQWRWVHIGLVAFILAHVMGLYLNAWNLNQQVTLKKTEIDALVRQTFPSIQVVLDAPVQMQKELDRLRNQQGLAGSHDFETLLDAVTSVWPPSKPWAQSINYESGELRLVIVNWMPDEFEKFKESSLFKGWSIRMEKNTLIIKRP